MINKQHRTLSLDNDIHSAGVERAKELGLTYSAYVEKLTVWDCKNKQLKKAIDE